MNDELDQYQKDDDYEEPFHKIEELKELPDELYEVVKKIDSYSLEEIRRKLNEIIRWINQEEADRQTLV